MKKLIIITSFSIFIATGVMAQIKAENPPAQPDPITGKTQLEQDEKNIVTDQKNIDAAKYQHQQDIDSKKAHTNAAKADAENIKSDNQNLKNDEQNIKAAQALYNQHKKEREAHQQATKTELKNNKNIQQKH